MKQISWAEVQKLPSGSIVKSVWKEREGVEEPVYYYFVVKQEAAQHGLTLGPVGEGTIRFYPEELKGPPSLGEFRFLRGNMLGFVYTFEGEMVGVADIVLSALKHYVFEADDISELLSATMRLVGVCRVIEEDVARVCAKAARPLFGKDAF